MATRVLRAGHDLALYVRRAEQAETLVRAGASAYPNVAAVAGISDVVITVLPGPADVRQVYLGAAGVLAAATPDTVCIDMTTSSPLLAQELAAAAEPRRIDVLDAPVSGGPFGAATGELAIMVGGPTAAVTRVRPLLDLLGTTIVHHGAPGAGQLAKLANQVLVAGVTQASCECFVLAAAVGLDPELLQLSAQAGAAGSPLAGFVISRLAAGDLSPGFKLGHFVKDLEQVREAATRAGVELPVTRKIHAAGESVMSRRGPEVGTQALVDAVSGTVSS
jgi:3-hydroxyisobutyrate dehydrogenase